jgi:hypothetical protein
LLVTPYILDITQPFKTITPEIKTRLIELILTLSFSILIIESMPGYYSVLSGPEIAVMTFALQTSSLLGIPTILHCFRKNSTVFEGLLFSMTLLASFMFHLCEIYEIEIFLK